MRVPAIAAGVVLLATSSACERRGRLESSSCDVNETGINDSTIGPLHIGEALAGLRVRCPAIADTAVATFGAPSAASALRLTVVGAPVIIRHDGKKVTGLHVESPFFRTNDSLGVGSSVAKFRNVPGIRVVKASISRAPILLDRRRCGVAYELAGWGLGVAPADSEPITRGEALVDWPDSIVVRGVTVAGCRGLTRDLGVDSVAESISDSTGLMHDSISPSDSITTTPSPVATATPHPLPGPQPLGSQPTANELAELRGKLDVPVQGVTRAQLRDTYTESRAAGRLHEALDIRAPRGTPVTSAIDGRLLKKWNSKAGGLMVYAADPSDRFILLYGHLDRYADGLREGMDLKRGQLIGYVGTTGNAPPDTPHLHFAILYGKPRVSWSRGTAVNPYPLLTSRGTEGP